MTAAGSLVFCPVPLASFDLGMLLLKLLAVAGGAVLGGALAGAVARTLTRFIIRRQAPQTLVFSCRIAGFALAGLAVWLWAFGTGGSGLGFGSGGLGSGGDSYIGYNPVKDRADKPPDSQAEQKSIEKPAPAGSRPARVEMLGGGRVRQDRFYVLDEQPQPLTIGELRDILAARKKQEADPLKIIEIVIYEDSVDKDHPAVRDLETWAASNGLQVTISFPQGKRP
jgi:hypothetical protein